MKDQSNVPPRSQKCDCLRLKAITEPLNPIHSQERLGVVFPLSSYISNNFTDSVFQVKVLAKVFFSRAK